MRWVWSFPPKDIYHAAARTLAEEIRHAGGVRRAVAPWWQDSSFETWNLMTIL